MDRLISLKYAFSKWLVLKENTLRWPAYLMRLSSIGIFTVSLTALPLPLLSQNQPQTQEQEAGFGLTTIVEEDFKKDSDAEGWKNTTGSRYELSIQDKTVTFLEVAEQSKAEKTYKIPKGVSQFFIEFYLGAMNTPTNEPAGIIINDVVIITHNFKFWEFNRPSWLKQDVFERKNYDDGSSEDMLGKVNLKFSVSKDGKTLFYERENKSKIKIPNYTGKLKIQIFTNFGGRRFISSIWFSGLKIAYTKPKGPSEFTVQLQDRTQKLDKNIINLDKRVEKRDEVSKQQFRDINLQLTDLDSFKEKSSTELKEHVKETEQTSKKLNYEIQSLKTQVETYKKDMETLKKDVDDYKKKQEQYHKEREQVLKKALDAQKAENERLRLNDRKLSLALPRIKIAPAPATTQAPAPSQGGIGFNHILSLPIRPFDSRQARPPGPAVPRTFSPYYPPVQSYGSPLSQFNPRFPYGAPGQVYR